MEKNRIKKELIYRSSTNEMKISAAIWMLGFLLIGFIFLYMAITGSGPTLLKKPIWQAIVGACGVFVVVFSISNIPYLFINDFLIYKNGFIWPKVKLKDALFKKEIFISFSDVKKIELITLAYKVKCLKITTIDKEYYMTKKEIKDIEKIYEKLIDAYGAYKKVMKS